MREDYNDSYSTYSKSKKLNNTILPRKPRNRQYLVTTGERKKKIKQILTREVLKPSSKLGKKIDDILSNSERSD